MPVGDPRWSSLFLKDCTLWHGPTLEEIQTDHGKNPYWISLGRTVSHGRDPMPEEEKTVQLKEQQRQIVMD